MKKSLFFFLYLYGMMFFLPLLLTVLVSGADVPSRFLSGEERFLPLMLSSEVPAGFSEEALKAQAVLVRTNYRVAGQNEETRKNLLRTMWESCDSIDEVSERLSQYAICQDAIFHTKEILTYEYEPRRVPYHLVNSGMTRDGVEVFHEDSYGYLVSVDSSWDRQSPAYVQSRYYPKDYGDNLEVLTRDSAGYVMEVQAGMEVLSGEELREQLQLPSSSFSFQMVDEQLRVLCRGEGHGLGLSQYGAQAMASEGYTYIEILNYYFPCMEIN